VAIGQVILRRMFARPTGLLGLLGGIIMARLNRAAAVQVIELLDVQSADCVLEIGFGPGVGIEILTQRASAGSVAGIDPSREMVTQAKDRNAQAIAAGRVELRQGSVDHLPFADGAFDKVLSINSMQVWPDAVAGMREVWRVLKAGGRVALGFTPYAGQSNEAVIGAVMVAGFDEPRVANNWEVSCVIVAKP
jgi:ubiquinone/menaquinone biosynthesis C-methylase UbiE